MAFEYRFQVGMSSVDAAGVLFFPELFRHAHDAYEVCMSEVGISIAALVCDGRHAIPVVHAEADYQVPITHGEAILIHLQVLNVGDTSFSLEYRFIGVDGRVRATARSVHVVVDSATRRSVSLPDSVRTALGVVG